MPSPEPEQALKRGKRGPEPFQPTDQDRAIVEAMAGYGIPEEEMVKLVRNPKTQEPISPVTLRKHFRQELDRGFVGANTKVAHGLFKNATTPTSQYPGGVPVTQIFWAKTRMRWNDGSHGQPPGPPPSLLSTDMQESARRIAFVLASAEKAKSKEPA